jgi:hypothetical protein
MSTFPVAQPYPPALAFADETPLRGLPFASDKTPTCDDIPVYLKTHYWWAYIHPVGVRLFERQWLVNLILWGNYTRLSDAALIELGEALPAVRCRWPAYTVISPAASTAVRLPPAERSMS